MASLVKADFRCRQHERFDHDCDSCCFLRRWESSFAGLHSQRARMIRELKERLQKQEIIILDIR